MSSMFLIPTPPPMPCRRPAHQPPPSSRPNNADVRLMPRRHLSINKDEARPPLLWLFSLPAAAATTHHHRPVNTTSTTPPRQRHPGNAIACSLLLSRPAAA